MTPPSRPQAGILVGGGMAIGADRHDLRAASLGRLPADGWRRRGGGADRGRRRRSTTPGRGGRALPRRASPAPQATPAPLGRAGRAGERGVAGRRRRRVRRGAASHDEQTLMAATSNDSQSARQACSGVDGLHALDQEPHGQPDFSDEAHGEPGGADRGRWRPGTRPSGTTAAGLARYRPGVPMTRRLPSGPPRAGFLGPSPTSRDQRP